MKQIGCWTRWVLTVLLAWIVLIFGIFWAIPVWMNLSPGDSYALGQLVLEAILLPVAILGFVWTYRQIRNALLPEQLDLAWDEGEERPPKRTSIIQDVPPSDEREGKQVCLVNQGSSIARWFVIEISLPV